MAKRFLCAFRDTQQSVPFAWSSMIHVTTSSTGRSPEPIPTSIERTPANSLPPQERLFEATFERLMFRAKGSPE